jgi:hypothetical protein
MLLSAWNMSYQLFSDAVLTKLNVWLLLLWWGLTQNESCRLCFVQQTLFKHPDLIQAVTLSNSSFKTECCVVLEHEFLAKSGKLKLNFSVSWTSLWSSLSCEPSQTNSGACNLFDSTHVALWHSEIGLVFHQPVGELEGDKNHVSGIFLL